MEDVFGSIAKIDIEVSGILRGLRETGIPAEREEKKEESGKKEINPT